MKKWEEEQRKKNHMRKVTQAKSTLCKCLYHPLDKHSGFATSSLLG